MQTTLRQRLEQFSELDQTQLFQFLEQQTGPLSEKMRLLGLGPRPAAAEPAYRSLPWLERPPRPRPPALATAFLAKSILGFQTTRHLLQSLQSDRTLRLLCGWNSPGAIPH